MQKSRKNIINHRVLHSPPIARKELGLVDKFQNSHVLVRLPLYAIFVNKTVTSSAGSNEARVDNIIHTMYAGAPGRGSSTEHVFTYRRRGRHNRDRGCTCFLEVLPRVCIARAAVYSH